MRLLKIQTLDKGWCDKDEVLLHAAFQLLADFVEQEYPDKVTDWTWNAEHRHVWKEITRLYRWWKRERPARKSPLDAKGLRHPPMRFKKVPGTDHSTLVEPDRKKYAAYYRALKKDWALEKKWLEEDQHNLHRLIEIRSHLWT
jgi:hypothetical protein